MLTTSSSFFFSICILSYAPLRQSYIPIPFQLHHRRILHQPFFPVEGSTPPSSPPSSSPSLPKFPSSTKTPPFFPFYPAPSPPPPAASLATFPANISSLDMPHNPSKKSFISAKTLVPILLSLLFLSLFIVFSLFFYRKHHKFTNKKRSRSNSRRLFPANGVASDGDKLGVSATSSEFLYLGTVVNSRRGDGEGDPENAARDSPYRKLGSPELHPLPPLARQSQQNYRNATGEGEEEEEDEEFYSPRGSLASKDSLTRTGSSSRRVFPVVDGEKIGGSSSNCSTRSYASSSSGSASVAQSSLPHPSKSPSPCPSSITSPQHLSSGSQSPLGISPERLPFIRFPNSVQNLSSIGTSPSLLPIQMSPKRLPFINSPNSIQNSNSNGASPLVLPISVKAESPPNIKSPDLGSKGIARDVEFLRPPPPPPPPLPPRQMTPSPPKQKTHSPSPPSSSIEKDLNKVPASAERIQDISDQIQQPAVRVGNLPKNQFSIPPPPPPPPPTAGFWDTPVARPPACWPTSRPPTLVTPSRIVESKNSVVVSPEKPGEENSDDEERNEETPRPKLKPLHWDKVRTSSDRAMVWDKMKSSSFQLNEEMVETLFVVNATNSNPKETNKRPVLPSPNQENRVLDPKKSQNIAILLRALNVTKEEVCEALLEGSTDSLGVELLETLLKMAPTKEEELKLKEYKDDSPMKLGPAESFLKAVLDIPFAFKRVDAMLYIANFDSEVNYLMNTFQTLEAACEELRSSRMFPKLLEAVLKTGNRMNVGTNRGDAHAFKLDTLLKLVDVKGTDGKTTLLHFVVQEISRSEGSRLSSTSQIPVTGKTSQSNLQDDVEFRKCGLEVVAGLGGELSNVKKAAAMDSDVLSSYVSKLSCGVGKIKEVMKLNVASRSQESTQEFSQAMNEFLKKAEEEIIRVQAQESVALSLVKEITEYFHGNSAKEEAHPFRIFMVVRDFLSILDQVCKEVAKINERTIVSSARQFPIPVNPMLPLVFPRLHIQKTESSDDEDSSLSSP